MIVFITLFSTNYIYEVKGKFCCITSSYHFCKNWLSVLNLLFILHLIRTLHFLNRNASNLSVVTDPGHTTGGWIVLTAAFGLEVRQFKEVTAKLPFIVEIS